MKSKNNIDIQKMKIVINFVESLMYDNTTKVIEAERIGSSDRAP